VEGTKCRITPQGGRKHPAGETVEIDTANILFIAGGAFVGLDNIVKSRVKGTSIGFSAQVVADNTSVTLDKTTPEDLIKFGMIPEFVGRFPSWVALAELSKADLVRIYKMSSTVMSASINGFSNVIKLSWNSVQTAWT
jgi:ATP-dependent Clp protease ATP-binding subunit ClpX